MQDNDPTQGKTFPLPALAAQGPGSAQNLLHRWSSTSFAIRSFDCIERLPKNFDDDDSHPSRPVGKPERVYFSGSLSRLQKHRDAVVDGQRLKRINLVSVQSLFRPGAVSGFTHRYHL